MLTQDQINQIVARNGGMWTDPETGRTYMAQYGSTGGVEQGGTNFLENIIGSQGGNFTQGNMISAVDPKTGKESADYLNPKSTLWQDALAFVGPPLMAAGLGYMASGGNLPFDVGGGGVGTAPEFASVGGMDAPLGTSSVNWGLPDLGSGLTSGVGSVLDGVPLTGGGWMSKIANAVGGADNLKLLGSLGAGLLAAGSPAPQQTRESKMDPRLDPYVYGDKGVIPMASLLYQNRTNPTSQTMTDRAALRARAKGLLGI